MDKCFHVKLFLNWSPVSFPERFPPVPLPERFRKGNYCHLKGSSMLQNFSSFINFQETKNFPSDILIELQEIRFKKPVDRPKYSVNLLCYALLVRYTATQAYKLLLKQFWLPSFGLLKNLIKVE